MRQFYVYIVASHRRVLYVGVTNNLERRIWEHRDGTHDGFTKKYKVSRLVHFETTGNSYAAICREKELKAWRRSKKVALIEAANPAWEDRSLGW
jgi:putative endonuclease